MKDKMFIGGFYGPEKSREEKDNEGNVSYRSLDFVTNEVYKKIADTGIRCITYLNSDFAKEPEEVLDNLKLAEKNGVQIFVQDTEIHEDMTDEQLFARLSNYNHYKSFAGIYVVDEPSNDGYLKNNIKRRIQRYYGVMQLLHRNNILGYMNMLPWFRFIGTKKAYRELFESYVSFCKAPFVSWDRYIFDGNRTARHKLTKTFFWNLDVAKEYADKTGVPFYSFVQAGAQWNDEKRRFESEPYHPTDTQLRWNVNVALLWGAKGIQYFPLMQPYWFAYAPDGKMDYERNGVIAANGEPTRWYAPIQKANAWIRKIEDVLMKCERTAVLAKGYYPETYTGRNAEGDDWVKEIEVSDEQDGTLVGAFDYEGKKVYMVLNYNHDTAQDITLTFDKKRNYKLITEDSENEQEGKKIKLSLTAGEAVLLVFE